MMCSGIKNVLSRKVIHVQMFEFEGQREGRENVPMVLVTAQAPV